MQTTLRTIAIAAILASACGGDEATTTSSAGSGGAGGSGGGGGAPACPPGTHVAPSGGCDATLTGWTQGPSLAQPRDHHVTFVAEAEAGVFLYAAGGIENNTTLLDSIEVASVGADGSLAPWTMTTPLPEVAAGASIAVVEHTVIVAGGYRQNASGNPMLSRATDVSVVQSDGTLAAWTVGPTLAVTRFHQSMVANGATLYVIGGLTGNNTDNTPMVERADVTAEGVLSAWTEVTPLPGKRSHHSATVSKDAIYVTGGLEGDPAGAHTSLADVLRAPIFADGSLGSWSKVGDLPDTLSTHSSFVHADHLYVLAGVEGSATNTAVVRRAPIASDGSVGSWEELPSLPSPRAHAHQTPLHDAFIYAAGGALNHASIAESYLGRFE